MADFWNDNLKIIKDRIPALYEVLTQETGNDAAGIVTSADGVSDEFLREQSREISAGVDEFDAHKVLYTVADGKLYQLDSMYNSEEITDIWSNGLEGAYNTKYLMFGFGNGMLCRALLNKSKPDVRVLIYEPSLEILKCALANFYLGDVLRDERLGILVPQMEKPEQDLYYVLSDMLDYMDLDNIRYMPYPNYEIIFPESYKYFISRKDTVSNSLVANRTVLQRFSQRYVSNTFYNLPYFVMQKSLSNLWCYMPSDLPAIIVSSGPSLSKNVDKLKAAKGKAIIIAADSAVSVLLNNDIVPDMFMCQDAKKHPKHFENPLTKKIPMAGTLQTTNVAFAGRESLSFFTNDGNPHVQRFMWDKHIDLPVLSSGGSVANTAMALMELMGITNIILVGQDLAFTGNKTHAEGSLRASWSDQLDKENNKCFVEGMDGQQILSSEEFNLYRRWFENEIIRYPYLNVINATEGGAKIHGYKEMTLEDAIATMCVKDFDIDYILHCACDSFTDSEKKELVSYFTCIPDEIKELKFRIKKGIRDYEKMMEMVLTGKYHTTSFSKLYEATQETAKALEKSPFMYYPECLVQTEIGDFMRDTTDMIDDEAEELKYSIDQGKRYMELMLTACDKAIETVSQLLDDNAGQYENLLSRLDKKNAPKENAINDGLKSEPADNSMDAFRYIDDVHEGLCRYIQRIGSVNQFMMINDRLMGLIQPLKEDTAREQILADMEKRIALMKRDLDPSRIMLLAAIYDATGADKYIKLLLEILDGCNNIPTEMKEQISEIITENDITQKIDKILTKR